MKMPACISDFSASTHMVITGKMFTNICSKQSNIYPTLAFFQKAWTYESRSYRYILWFLCIISQKMINQYNQYIKHIVQKFQH